MPTGIRPDPPIVQPGTPLVVGLGCRRGCSAETLRELIESSLRTVDLEIGSVTALASIDLKDQEPGLLELAGQLAVPLVFFNAAQLVAWELHLTHRSAQVLQTTGCHGVAEGSALALAAQLGDGTARLVIERQKSTQVTFALATCPVAGG
ncbi:cobalamin biosynthesis protein [Pseudomonas syringae]|uniref:Cobalamin biosynthesis protein CobE n=1 Tax=Pseudomonas syringae TaxID=317 RepID=A0A9Q4FJI3_PSESX|nr:cobalamin biosynthesis protein [Pseudomonas syringae]MCF5466814.1 cobalamin biosynthesis protein CobE [Pseudomonas syringae]MCF5471695.1 cobalamin biosynthesis protein CobE [Pseudomonas syringae]MCF5482672.1 cobalamin biosynthesis protein CobE [Pseudomonas syringae]MCF5489051.1 cobalamin biosynthesis protein CobE [Pseudomonas syringae]MCF5491960.1 cobalamin biosynthesis protein CobE [Pseudomonas syringae]